MTALISPLSREAPKLKKNETSELLRFLDRFEEELKKASIVKDEEKIENVVRFVDGPLAREWEALDSFSSKDWDKFKKELEKNYPEALHDVRGAIEGLTQLSHRYNGINGYSKNTLATYSREFKTEWKQAKTALGERDGVMRYLSSLSEPFREKILSRLQTQREVKRQTNACLLQVMNGLKLTSDISPLRPLVKVDARDTVFREIKEELAQELNVLRDALKAMERQQIHTAEEVKDKSPSYIRTKGRQ
ncbi:hypothetical protein DL96DRAFT_1557402 [Flagelloscypha sp. PMI_526]|nr:hypothetical protein DL96DRAFT_1557402 [Flagelloscypha sp. PMI_526]